MGISGGPNIIRDSSLILELDTADRNSYVSGSTTWNDVTSYGNSMSNINIPGYTSNYGGGIVYNGSTQYSSISGTENQITSSAVTAEVVCSVTSNTFTSVGGNTTSQFIAFRQNVRTGNYEGYQIGYVVGSGTSFGYLYAIASSATATVSIATGSSNYSLNTPIVVSSTFDSSFIKLYINGNFISQVTTSFAINYNTNHKLTLGRANPYGNTWDGYFNGVIYNYKQYNRVLSAQEIQQNYNQLKSRFNL